MFQRIRAGHLSTPSKQLITLSLHNYTVATNQFQLPVQSSKKLFTLILFPVHLDQVLIASVFGGHSIQ